MAGKKFLNPTLKIIICLFGIILLGYFIIEPLNEAIFHNGPVDRFLVGRILVVIGFLYLLIQSGREIVSNRENSKQ